MKNHFGIVLASLVTGISVILVFEGRSDPAKAGDSEAASALLPSGVEEARGRARLLHESIHGTLQLVHRDFFDPNDHDFIPSATLEEVFKDLSKKQKVDVRWLGVEGKTMNVDHKPKDQFERNAVDALRAGKDEFELIADDRYRRAGPILLHNACLKCHVPKRTSLEDRVAGLVISIPLKKQ
ncbi:MAG: DUF3365 domain-containing protein [Akkermansiaceae bacterium]